MQNTRFCLQQEGQATEKKISLPEGVACSEGWLEGPRKWVRFGGLLQALWINKCKPGTLFVFFFQGVPTQPMGLGFPLDTQGLWFRGLQKNLRPTHWWVWHSPFMSELAPLSWSPRLDSDEDESKRLVPPSTGAMVGAGGVSNLCWSKDQHFTLGLSKSFELRRLATKSFRD